MPNRQIKIDTKLLSVRSHPMQVVSVHIRHISIEKQLKCAVINGRRFFRTTALLLYTLCVQLSSVRVCASAARMQYRVIAFTTFTCTHFEFDFIFIVVAVAVVRVLFVKNGNRLKWKMLMFMSQHDRNSVRSSLTSIIFFFLTIISVSYADKIWIYNSIYV